MIELNMQTIQKIPYKYTATTRDRVWKPKTTLYEKVVKRRDILFYIFIGFVIGIILKFISSLLRGN